MHTHVMHALRQFVVVAYMCRLNTLGYRNGTRILELMAWRNESASKAPKRETRFLPALMFIHTHVWRAVFGKPADAIEKSVENADECTCSASTKAHSSASILKPYMQT